MNDRIRHTRYEQMAFTGILYALPWSVVAWVVIAWLWGWL